MPKLPQVSGEDVVQLLRSTGYQVLRQRGSHIRLQKKTPSGIHNITIPNHNPIAKGTLSDILNKVSLWNNVSKEILIKKLK